MVLKRLPNRLRLNIIADLCWELRADEEILVNIPAFSVIEDNPTLQDIDERASVVAGSAAAELISAGDGADTMLGGGGADTYSIGGEIPKTLPRRIWSCR